MCSGRLWGHSGELPSTSNPSRCPPSPFLSPHPTRSPRASAPHSLTRRSATRRLHRDGRRCSGAHLTRTSLRIPPRPLTCRESPPRPATDAERRRGGGGGGGIVCESCRCCHPPRVGRERPSRIALISSSEAQGRMLPSDRRQSRRQKGVGSLIREPRCQRGQGKSLTLLHGMGNGRNQPTWQLRLRPALRCCVPPALEPTLVCSQHSLPPLSCTHPSTFSQKSVYPGLPAHPSETSAGTYPCIPAVRPQTWAWLSHQKHSPWIPMQVLTEVPSCEIPQLQVGTGCSEW